MHKYINIFSIGHIIQKSHSPPTWQVTELWSSTDSYQMAGDANINNSVSQLPR